MTPNQFRKLALALPDATEGAHGGHADFRVGGKVFASLGYPDATFGMVKLTPDQQAMLTESAAKTFMRINNAWGLKGYTHVRLAEADAATLKHALTLAHRNCAPKAKRTAASRTAGSAHLGRVFARVCKAAKATGLPGVEEGTSYGTPSLTVKGKFLMRVKDADTYAFRCTMEEKVFLMEAEPSIYFETDHYVGWPVVLVRGSASDAELAHCVARAWRVQAPKKLRAGHEHPASGRKTNGTESPARKRSRKSIARA